ncbi:MAG: FprA family A-type flavoprotein [Lachnospiraceae bacterium]
MQNAQQISQDIYWVGGNDRRLALFENLFPIPQGVSYNSYLIIDEKITLVDTVDQAISRQFIENITYLLNGRSIDYLIVNHMEPDHCADIEELARRYPEMKIVGNKKTFQMIGQFYTIDSPDRLYEVKEKDELCIGTHTLKFYFAPMVHWPEVMVTFEMTKGILFSADAFGSFGALSGNLFSDETDFDEIYLDEARRYYTNIVGKYGVQVQNVLKKLGDLKINMICSLHGPIWRENLSYIVDKYQHWSSYKPEKKGVVLAYASMYGNTENVMSLLAAKLSERGISDMRMFDVSKTHPSYIISDIFKYSNVVLASPTYNAGLYYMMEALLREMEGLNIQKRGISLIGNGSWAPVAVKVMKEHIQKLKNITLIGEPFEIRSALKEDQIPELDRLADAIAASVKGE